MREILDVLLLMSLGMGYLVLYFAKREDKIFKMTGYIIGMVIIFLTTFYIIIDTLTINRVMERRPQRYMMHQRMMLPPAATPQK